MRFVHRPGAPVPRVHRTVHDHRHAHVRVRLQAERQDRDADEQDRDYADHLFTNIYATFINRAHSFAVPSRLNEIKQNIVCKCTRIYRNSLDSLL